MRTPSRLEIWLAASGRLIIYIGAFFAAITLAQHCTAKADSGQYQYSEKHVKAYGDRAWIADRLQKHYLSAVDAAGPELDRVPLAYREFFIRDVIAWTACLLTMHWTTDRHPDVILKHCANDEVEKRWRINLNRALVRSGYFQPEPGRPNDLAIMPMRRVNVVLRYMIRKTTREDAKRGMIFDNYAVPKLVSIQKELDALAASQKGD